MFFISAQLPALWSEMCGMSEAPSGLLYFLKFEDNTGLLTIIVKCIRMISNSKFKEARWRSCGVAGSQFCSRCRPANTDRVDNTGQGIVLEVK